MLGIVCLFHAVGLLNRKHNQKEKKIWDLEPDKSEKLSIYNYITENHQELSFR